MLITIGRPVRATASALGFFLLASGVALAAPGDPPPPITVVPGDSLGNNAPPSVDVKVHASGRPGQPAAAGENAGTQGGRPVCRWIPAAELEAWLRRLPEHLPAGGSGGVSPAARLFEHVCSGVVSGFAWFGPAQRSAAAPPSPDELAREAQAELRLPAPSPGRSPDLRLAGSSAVLVGEQTWVWTDRSAFSARSRLVRVGGVWARATAVPMELSFDPGTGDPVLRCAGPGTPFPVGRYLPHAASPTCGVVLTQSSARFPGGVVTAVWAVRWRVSWVGAAAGRAESGVLTEMVSRTRVVLAVAEGQALVTG